MLQEVDGDNVTPKSAQRLLFRVRLLDQLRQCIANGRDATIAALAAVPQREMPGCVLMCPALLCPCFARVALFIRLPPPVWPCLLRCSFIVLV